MSKEVWLIGPGNIGEDYARVLLAQNIDFKAIGRSEKPDFPVAVYAGGLTKFIENSGQSVPDYAIVAVDESQLFNITMELIDFGVKNILVEKPAGISTEEVRTLNKASEDSGCSLFVAYNRRFYQSVRQCKKLIEQSKTPVSATFTFTEWTHSLPFDWYNDEELEKFFLCNSSHVPDTVFYLIGRPFEMHCYTDGGLTWHPSASIFSGAGITTRGIPFSYNANWESAGRWGIEIDMEDKKLILRPLEKLQILDRGALVPSFVTLPGEDKDENFKPGLFEEVRSFLGEQNDLCTIKEQLGNFSWYYRIANYT